ncbi:MULTISPECIES: hypothetical protein [Corynebacterium]|uniref:hypothetical protein n=1 Tax=Corynebacterium TaxID=1716 RepID=UPI000ACD0C03|nr:MULTISPECIES: hypothetical protein [Corynebacterium]QJS14792.1 hypothetical protein HK412_13095 [Corynebacterium glutamicum]QXU45620.1 hypothetical protein KW808_14975 [[Brevibacterium] flavum]
MTLIKLGQFRRNFLDLDQLPTHLRPDEVEQKSMPRGLSTLGTHQHRAVLVGSWRGDDVASIMLLSRVLG